ncbi:hypothetical protein J1605_002522 [Eschrichtius robustus]|uniref:Uncharacterized protein n=1 Tax=Eschrichtius robustus TaxID=9764 RepID=A0AB34HX87_ESCRO|nr:hypothetical protein J1605_002522 [Eschrichtius robustus]
MKRIYIVKASAKPKTLSPPGEREWAAVGPAQPSLTPVLPSSQWDLICTHKTLPQLSQSIIMAGVLVGNLMLGIMADRFFIESALWHSSLGNLDLTLKALQRVAQIKGKQKEGAKLSVEVRPPRTLSRTPGASQAESGGRGPQGNPSPEPHLSKPLLRMSLQKGLTMSRAWPSTLQLLRSPAIRQLFLCIMPLWFVLLFSFYGLIMGLQSLGINIYLTQVLFTTVDLPFYFLGFLTTKSLGCKHTQMGSLLLSGNFILTCAMIPLASRPISAPVLVLSQAQFPIWPKPTTWKGMKTPSLLQTFPNTLSLPLFVPDQRGPSATTTLANTGSILSPLVGMTSELYPSLPLFIYGAVLVAACPITVLLPETLGLPLPNTLQDLERRKFSLQTNPGFPAGLQALLLLFFSASGLLWLLPELMGFYTGPGSLPPAPSTDRHLLPQPQGGAEEGPCDLYLALKLLAQMCNRASKPQPSEPQLRLRPWPRLSALALPLRPGPRFNRKASSPGPTSQLLHLLHSSLPGRMTAPPLCHAPPLSGLYLPPSPTCTTTNAEFLSIISLILLGSCGTRPATRILQARKVLSSPWAGSLHLFFSLDLPSGIHVQFILPEGF